MSAFRITNVTNLASQGRGFFLDMGKDNGGKHISVGGQIVVEASSYDTLPQCIHDWASQSFIRVTNLDLDGKHVAGFPPQAFGGEMTSSMINPVSEARSSEDLDEEPDLTDAISPRLPQVEATSPISQDIRQMGARITDAAAEERYSTDMSPIPGDKPKNVDDNERFTIRAPRSQNQGGVIGKSK